MVHPAPSESHDSSGAAAGSGISQRPADLAALTSHDDFLLELGEVLAGRASVHPTDSLDAALERLSAARGRRILAIDARGAGNVRADVERAAHTVRDAMILVFADASTEKTVAAAVKGTRVFAVLPLPMEAGKTSAVIDAALANAAEHNAPRPTAPLGTRRVLGERPSTGQAAANDRARPEKPRAGPRGKLLAAAVVGLALALSAGAAWWQMRGSPSAVQTPSKSAPQASYAALTKPVVDRSIVQGRVSDLLEKASRAMFERHFTSPKGDNALVFYRSVLAADPTNAEAQNGLQRVVSVLVSRFTVDLNRAHYGRASLALATLQFAQPKNPHIAPFHAELSSALVEQALSSGQKGAVPALIDQAARWGVSPIQIKAWQKQLGTLQHHEHIQTLAHRVSARAAAGRLTGPHSAESAFAQLRTIAPHTKTTRSAAQTLIRALLGGAQRAGLAGQPAQQDRWLNAARSAGATTQQVDAVRQRIAGARTHAAALQVAQLLGRVRARLASGALLEPLADNAAYYLHAVDQANPDPAQQATANQLRGRLVGALVTQAKAAARAGEHATALRDLAAARRWGASASTLAATAKAAAKPAAPTAAQLAQVAANLRRTHYVAPIYPHGALARGVSGQVIVQYTVDMAGRTRHLQVISSKPGVVFTRAALNAIRRWRYAPPRFHGRPVSVPVRTLIRFELPN